MYREKSRQETRGVREGIKLRGKSGRGGKFESFRSFNEKNTKGHMKGK